MEVGGYDPSNNFIAPDFKRRQLLFDSFSKLQQKSLSDNTSSSSSALSAASASANAAAAAIAINNNNSNSSRLALNLAQNNNNASNNSSSSTSGTVTPIANNLLVSDGAKGTLLYGWGAGYHGQLGLNTARKKCRLQPSCIDFHEPVQMVACGGFHTAVLTDDGRVYTWGDGRLGQLGNLARKHNMHSTPRLVDYLVAYKVCISYIACGQYHTAAVSNTGRLFTWGSGKWGQLGHGVRQDERFPRKVETEKSLGNFIKVACGDRHTAGLNESGGIITFGNGQHGQLGHGNGLDCLKPTLLTNGELATQKVIGLDSGATTTAAVTENGALYLWGFGESLHPKGVSNVLESPRQVRIKENVKQVACGLGHVLVLTEGGDVYAFGVASMGQIGHGTKNNVRNPRLILRGKEIYQIAAGRYHSMAVSLYGIIYSWGCSESGQTGANMNLENEYLPRIIDTLLPNVVGHISCGEHHSLALTSISHASVSPDVVHWKMIEDSELALKKQLLKETPNGLKTKHILQIEQQRDSIITALAESLRKEKEEKQRAATEKMQMIQNTEKLMTQIQASVKKRSAFASATSTSQAAAALEASADTSSSAFSNYSLKQVESAALRFASTGNQQQESKESLTHSDESDDVDDDERKREKRLAQQIAEMRSGTQSTSQSRTRSPTRSPNSSTTPRDNTNTTSSITARPEHPENEEKEQISAMALSVINDMSGTSRPTSVPSVRTRFPPLNRTDSEETTTNSNGVMVSTSGNTHGSNIPTEVGFAPLAPRIAFIEQTTKTLSKVKAFMSNTAIPAESNYLNDLIRVKKNYNSLKAERQRLEKHHRTITHELSLCQPNHEEQQLATIAAEQLKSLNMKLVTLNTRLMEAEENKKNYELYIIRMKEEDLQLGKQIDHLRSICAEYTRLLHKLQKMNIRVDHQRMEVIEETHSFVNDVGAFMGFADTVVKDYRRVLNNSYKQSCYQEQLFHQRQQRVTQKRQQKIEALKQESLTLQQQQQSLSMEIQGWEEKVEYYEKRFRKVAAATGLTRAEQIISKFYFNDEITQDLQREITSKQTHLSSLLEQKQQLSNQLKESAAHVNVSKWKDVNESEEKNALVTLTYSKQVQEYEKWTHRLTQVLEGIKQLTNKVAIAIKAEDMTIETSPTTTAEEAEATEDEETNTTTTEEEQTSENEETDEIEKEREELKAADELTAATTTTTTNTIIDHPEEEIKENDDPFKVNVPSSSNNDGDDDDDEDDGSVVVDVTRLLNEVAITTAANIAKLSTPASSLTQTSNMDLSALSPHNKHHGILPRYHPANKKHHRSKPTDLLSAATGFTESSVQTLETRLVSVLSSLVSAVEAGKTNAVSRAEKRAALKAEALEAEQMTARTDQLAALLLNPRKNIWESLQEKVEQNTSVTDQELNVVKTALGDDQSQS